MDEQTCSSISFDVSFDVRVSCITEAGDSSVVTKEPSLCYVTLPYLDVNYSESNHQYFRSNFFFSETKITETRRLGNTIGTIFYYCFQWVQNVHFPKFSLLVATPQGITSPRSNSSSLSLIQSISSSHV